MIHPLLSSKMTILFFVAMVPASTGVVTLSVPGTSDSWRAGMPAGSTASISHVGPVQSPTLVPGLNINRRALHGFNHGALQE